MSREAEVREQWLCKMNGYVDDSTFTKAMEACGYPMDDRFISTYRLVIGAYLESVAFATGQIKPLVIALQRISNCTVDGYCQAGIDLYDRVEQVADEALATLQPNNGETK